MTGSDPFEDRLRETLRADDASADKPDVDAFLDDVHRGARSRRRRRGAALGAAAALVVIGAGAVGSLGLVDRDDSTPIADGSTHTTAAATSDTAPMTGSAAGQTVNFTADNTRILSVTSTDDTHQWALAQTETSRCGGGCFSVVTRSPDSGDWGAPSIVTNAAHPASQLRYVAAASGGFDGWAFGPALFSIHGVDGGPDLAMWQSVDVGGSVTSLEAHGQVVYALVEAQGQSTLVTSPTDDDAFETVDTGPLGDASSLVATAGVVAFLNATDTGTEVLSSRADPDTGRVSGEWTPSQPCRPGSEPVSLSSASDALWALCTDGRTESVSFRPSGGDAWTPVPSYRTGTGSLLTARSADSAVLHLADNTALMLVTPDGASRLTDGSPGFSNPTMLGFTNRDLGFAVAEGDLWRSTDGGQTWRQEHVLP
jgi:hypothetical protein